MTSLFVAAPGMLLAAARRLSGAAASVSSNSCVSLRCQLGSMSLKQHVRFLASEPHNDDWEANFEDLMAMEDSYGSGVEDLSSAAAELAGARMAEQKRLQEEMRRLRGIQPGDRVKVRVKLGAPYPEVVKRYHYASPFGGAGLGHAPGEVAEDGETAGDSTSDDATKDIDESIADDSPMISPTTASKKTKEPSARRWKIVAELGYVVCVRGDRVGVKRNGHAEDTLNSFPTYPKSWVEVLDVGEMWEMKTGPRNLGAFASEEDYAQAQQDWADATSTVNASEKLRKAGK